MKSFFAESTNTSTNIVNYEHLTLVDLIELMDEEFSDLPAFCNTKGEQFYFNQLILDARSLAKFLLANGFTIGERVSIRMSNRVEYIIACYGVILAGGVIVNINPLCALEQYEKLLNQADVRYMIGDIEGEVKLVSDHRMDIILIEAIARGERSKVKLPVLSSEHLAVLQFTSATTDEAKAVLLNHQNILVNAMQMRASLSSQLEIGAETWLNPLPLHHHFAFMFVCWFIPLMGGKTLLASPREGEAFWQILEQQPVTAILGVEPFYSMLLHHPDLSQLSWRHVKFSVACSVSLKDNTHKRWRVICNSPIYEAYSLSETSGVVAMNTQGTVENTLQVVPLTQIKIVARDGTPVDQGEVGELYVKGPQLFKGYDALNHARSLDEQGYFKTGDLVKHCGEGSFEVIDRKTDCIVIQGVEFYPNEIERLIKQLPGVSDCGVCSVTQQHGQQMGVVVTLNDEAINKKTIVEWLHHHYHDLTQDNVADVLVVDQLPMSTIGKVLRRNLTQQFGTNNEQ